MAQLIRVEGISYCIFMVVNIPPRIGDRVLFKGNVSRIFEAEDNPADVEAVLIPFIQPVNQQ